MNNFFNGMFGRIQNGMCRVSMNGDMIVNREISYMFSIDDTLKQLFEKSVILTIKN